MTTEQPIFDTLPYRRGIADEGPQALVWADKPSRLVFDLCSEIERLQYALSTTQQRHVLELPEDADYVYGWGDIARRLDAIHGEGHST